MNKMIMLLLVCVMASGCAQSRPQMEPIVGIDFVRGPMTQKQFDQLIKDIHEEEGTSNRK